MNLQFTRFTLSNGLELIVKENHFAQSVVVRGYIPGGANLDTANQAGRASFAAQAMRRGAGRRTFAEINEAVEAVGASVYVNAGRHTVGFGGKSLAEDFSLLVEILSDILQAPTFPPAEIEKLRGQIITSLQEDEDDTRSVAQRLFRELLYGPDHPYGRPVDGTLTTVPRLTRDDLLTFYRRLHPHGGAVVVVGDIQPQAVYEALEQTLAGWRPDQPPPADDLPPVSPPATAVRQVRAMPQKSQADLVLGWIGPSRQADDYYAALVADTILGHLGLGGRIGRTVRDEHGMAYYARSALYGGPGPGPWFVYAGVNPAGLDRAVELILEETRRFRESPVTGQELEDAQSFLTGVLPLQMESNEGVASTLLDMHLYNLGDDFITRYPALIRGVTVDDVQAVAQKYLSEEWYALSIAGPVNS
ncbi:MAG: insulinase family protein [Chloroflexi bacterium]|nr:MAG: insulinase family protein [Chloroflexota bacterium]